MMRKRVALCLALALCVPQLAAARDEEEDKATLLELLRIALVEHETAILERVSGEEMRSALSEDPDLACKACCMVEENARGLTQAADSVSQSKTIIAAFVDVGARVVRDHPQSPDALRAQAHALGARGRHQLVISALDGQGPWEECARLCMEASKLSTKNKTAYLGAAAAYLTEWVPYAGDRAQEVLQQAVQVCEEGLRASPGDAALTGALARTYLQVADVALQARKKGDAKKAVADAEALLRPAADLPSGKAGDARAAAYNEVVAFALAHAVPLKAEFLVETRKASSWTASYPRGTGWKWSLGGGTRGVLDLVKDYPGGRVRIYLESYKWDMNYTADGGEAGGDNVGGLMAQDRKLSQDLFGEVKKHKDKISGKLNRRVTKTIGYQLTGLDKDGKPLTVRGYYFKGDEHRETFGLDIYVHGDVSDDDPELALILERLEEREATK